MFANAFKWLVAMCFAGAVSGNFTNEFEKDQIATK
jgi:hypothetical protein